MRAAVSTSFIEPGWLWRLLLGEPSRERASSRRHFARALSTTLVLVAATLGVAIALTNWLHVSANLLLFFPAVVLAALRYGFGFSLWTAAASVLAISFTLAEPIFSFAVADPATWEAMVAFVLVAGLASSLAARVREQMFAIQAQNRLTQSLYEFSGRLTAVADFDSLAAVFADEVGRLVGGTAGLLLQGDTDPVERCEHVDPTSGEVALSVPVGRSGKHIVVARIVRDRKLGALSKNEARLLDALLNQCMATLERLRLSDVARGAQVQAEAERLRAALLTAVSHDLKTPLASILGNISSLRRYSALYDDDTRLEMLEAAESATERLSRFVENLLHMTRIDAGAVVCTIEKVDLADVVGTAMKAAARLLGRHRVRVDLATDLPMIDADQVLLDHVLVNLLDNAAKYSPEGSLIRLSVVFDGDEIGLRVDDEGPGVPPQHLDRIFDRFFRANGGNTTSGTGLGLAICKSFTTLMNARLTAENRVQGGASFTIWFRMPTAAEAR